MMRQRLAVVLLLSVVAVGTRAVARGRCPAGFTYMPRTAARCVQQDCIAVGGVHDRDMRCGCGAQQPCTEPLTYKRRARARCKDFCPEQRVVACVAPGQPCPTEQTPACEGDRDCPGCTYCKAGHCAPATALIATLTSPTGKGRGQPATGWRGSRVSYWQPKSWAARYLLLQGCRLSFRDVEDGEQLAQLLSDEQVKALAYFGPCTEDALRTVPGKKPEKDIFGKTQPAVTQYQPTLAGMTAEELKQQVQAALEQKLTARLRRQGKRRAAAKRQAADDARQVTEKGWLHFLLNATCHSLDDTSVTDTLVRPGGVSWGRKGTPPAGMPLTRQQREQ